MPAYLPDGSILAIASTYAAVKNMTALSNAASAVATLEASHGVTVGNILEVTSGWGAIDGLIVRASAVSTNDVTLEKLKTTNTTRYPAGGGIGSVRKVTAWTPLNKILDFDTEGGDQKFTEFEYLEEFEGRRLPGSRSPITLKIDLADDPTQPWYDLIMAADEDRAQRAVSLTLPTGGILYYNGIISCGKTPTLKKGAVASLRASVSLVAPVMRY